MAYLIDTDILVDYIRGNLDAAAYLQSLDEWSYSVVTAMELFAGAQNKREIRAIEKVLKNFRETPLSRTIGSRGREIVKDYVKSDGIDPLDAMIAAAKSDGPSSLHQRRKRGCQCSSARCSVRSPARLTLLGIFCA